MVSAKAILYGFPIFFALVWNFLDANPSLYWYDKIATLTGKWQHSSLQGKTVWVTGASSGIGASLICELMRARVGHVVLSSRNRDKLEQVAQRCKETTNAEFTQVSIVPYDAANTELVDATVDSVLAFTGGNLDIVILNAGIYQIKPALQTSKQERDIITLVNYQAPVDLTDSLLQKTNWKQRGYGHLVVVTSVMAHGPHGLSSTYAASKAALRSYFQSLSTEEISWLRVDVACPGGTDTAMWDSTNAEPSRGAATMTPDRVAQLVLTGVAGPQALFFETWMAKFPNLLWVWLRHWTPTFFHLFVHVMAHVRVPVWQHERIDLLDVPTLVSKLFWTLLGRYP